RHLRGAPGGAIPPPRPSFRVDARGVRVLGGARRRRARVHGPLPARRPGGSGARRADADGGVRGRMSRTLEIPELSLVVLVGASGSGKSTFARTHFLPTEVVSSDFCRGLVSDDDNAQDATSDAFELLHYIAGKRMTRGRLTVVDATNVQPEARKPLVSLAREHHFLPVAIVFDLPERLCQDRNRERPDRDFGPHVVRNQVRQLKR